MRWMRGLAAVLLVLGIDHGLSAQERTPPAFVPVASGPGLTLGIPRPAPAAFPAAPIPADPPVFRRAGAVRFRGQQGEEGERSVGEVRTLPATGNPTTVMPVAKGPRGPIQPAALTSPFRVEEDSVPETGDQAPPLAQVVYPQPVPGGLRAYFSRFNPWTGLPWIASAPGVRQAGAVAEAELPGTSEMAAAEPNIVWAEPSYPAYRVQVGAEFLYWWTRGSNTPPLATTGSPAQPPQTAGSFRDPQVAVLYGGQNGAMGHPGARFHALWWQDDGLWALEGGGFFLSEGHNRFRADEATYPVLARPFIGANPELAATPALAELVAYPGIGRGSLIIEESTRMSGLDLGARRCLCSGECWNLAGRAGLLHRNLEDELLIFEDVTALVAVPPSIAAGDRGIVVDNFGTRNRFWGGYLGLRGEYWWGSLFLEGNARVALGNVSQRAQITGYQNVLRANGTRGLFPGGLLALPNRNIGTFTQDRFGVIPEVGLKVGYQVTPLVRAYVGYDFQFWNSVLRAGDQIDPRIDLSLVPNRGGGALTPVPVPVVPMRTTTFWAQGINAGLEVRY